MTQLIDFVIIVLVGMIIFLPSLFLFFELCLGLVISGKPNREGDVQSYKILIPAHNEADIIVDTLVKLKIELGSLVNVVVIADNCSDNTASLVRSQGADVVERQHSTLKGKGYALDAGVQYVANSAPETVVVFDADCEFVEGGFRQLVLTSQQNDSVVQSLYLMKTPAAAQVTTRIAEFAWLVKNLVRPMGLAKLDINCQLQGSGMAFPWRIFEKVSFASGSIVEDLELGLKLNNIGERIIFDPLSQVNSFFPSSEQGSETQRTRWEHGHMASISILPRAIVELLKQGRLKGCFTALDAMIPPTVLWVMLVFVTSVFTGLAALFMTSYAFNMALFSLFLILTGLFLTWYRYGRNIIGVKDVFSIFAYVLSKFNIYKKFLGNRQKDWVRTDRGD
jgi:cellulose synthase/poly-beta-1,6-N-acetylglucosamine synthase-like glycosyltransferase